MKTILLALLLLISGTVASASVVKFSDATFADTELDHIAFNKYKPEPTVSDNVFPNYGLQVAAVHNNVPNRVLENLSDHPHGCCKAMTSAQSVPLPAAAWLFMSGLAGLIRLAHRRKKDC